MFLSDADRLNLACGFPLPKDVELTPPTSMLTAAGEMNWNSVCKSQGGMEILRRQSDSWLKEFCKKKEGSCGGFGTAATSYWLGPKLVYNITSTGKWNVEVDVEVRKA